MSVAARRVAWAVLGAGFGVGLLTGCQAADNLGGQYVSAHFVLGTSLAERGRVARACTATHVAPVPLPTSPTSPAARLDLVRFDVTKASPQDLTELTECLRQFPDVLTVDPPTGP